MIKIADPSTFIVEQTAGRFAAEFFEAARNSNLKIIMLQGRKINLMKYKENPRNFARAHLEAFIPAAVHALIEIMSKDTTPIENKEIIYKAVLERVNDANLDMMGKAAGLPEYQNTVLYKPDDEKPKPIIINTPKIDFDYNNRKV